LVGTNCMTGNGVPFEKGVALASKVAEDEKLSFYFGAIGGSRDVEYVEQGEGEGGCWGEMVLWGHRDQTTGGGKIKKKFCQIHIKICGKKDRTNVTKESVIKKLFTLTVHLKGYYGIHQPTYDCGDGPINSNMSEENLILGTQQGAMGGVPGH